LPDRFANILSMPVKGMWNVSAKRWLISPTHVDYTSISLFRQIYSSVCFMW